MRRFVRAKEFADTVHVYLYILRMLHGRERLERN